MSAIEEIQKFVKDTLQELLDNLKKGFEGNELAYLSSQGKNELQIRDKIAWRLHKEVTKKYGKQYVVCREWGPKGKGREKIDLAVLELNANCTDIKSVIAIIEFKAQSIVKRENWYLTEFEHDIKKMQKMVNDCNICKDADLYFVFLETGQAKKVEAYKPIIAYSQYLTCNVKYRKDADYISSIRSHWEEFNNVLPDCVKNQELKVIDIGEAYGYKQYISPLIIGPLKAKNIKLSVNY